MIFLEEAESAPKNSPFWLIVFIVYLLLVLAPWIFLLFKFVIFRRLRVSYYLPNNKLLMTSDLKKGEMIIPPTPPVFENHEFVGWFIDEEMTIEYIEMPMPNKNIKLYAKYQKKDNGE